MRRRGVVTEARSAAEPEGVPGSRTLRRRRRGSARCAHGLARQILSGLLAVTAVLSPWQSGLLPEPFDRIGAQPAAAQSAVIAGTPAPCLPHPDATNPDGLPWMEHAGPDGLMSLCRVTGHPPCPLSPLAAGGHMDLVERRADLCEAVADQAADPDLVRDCLRVDVDGNVIVDADGDPDPPGVAGYVNVYEEPGGVPECRLLYPAACAGGLYRVGDECVGHRRRLWTCPTSHPRPLNRFNSCYGEPAVDMSAGHPACSGAPQLATVRCEDYVGDDFVVNPDQTACDRYDDVHNNVYRTAVVPRDAFARLTASDHWCSYPVRHLYAKCFGGANPGDPDCDPMRRATCIMRASGIGGCDGIAHTMLCRSLQADYADARDRQENARSLHPPDSPEVASADAAEVTAERLLHENICTPCFDLPFDAASTCGADETTERNAQLGLGGPSPTNRAVPRSDAVDFRVFGGPSRTCHASHSSIQPRLYCAYAQHDTSAVFAAFIRGSYTEFTGLQHARQWLAPQTSVDSTIVPQCSNWQQRLLRDMAQGTPPQSSMPEECREFLCASPTVGEVGWSSQHVSALAVVGTPVALTVSRIPLGKRVIRYINRRFPPPASVIGTSGTAWVEMPAVNEVTLPAFSNSRVLDFGPSDAVAPDRAISSQADSSVSRFECSLRGPGPFWDRGPDGWDRDEWVNPEFSVVVTQLWPDEDEAEIERLFGGDALDWWDDPGFDRDAASSARGYRLTDGLPEAEADAERDRREIERVEVIPCQHPVAADPDSLTCQWVPSSNGYYAVQAAGIWKLNLHKVWPVRPLAAPERDILNATLGDASHPQANGRCEPPSSRDPDCLAGHIDWMFDFTPPPGTAPALAATVRATLAQIVGLSPDLDSLLDEHVRPVADPPRHRCVALQDFRYACRPPYDPGYPLNYPAVPQRTYMTANYTTSEPIGIMVHGAHVVTRRPGGR